MARLYFTAYLDLVRYGLGACVLQRSDTVAPTHEEEEGRSGDGRGSEKKK